MNYAGDCLMTVKNGFQSNNSNQDHDNEEDEKKGEWKEQEAEEEKEEEEQERKRKRRRRQSGRKEERWVWPSRQRGWVKKNRWHHVG